MVINKKPLERLLSILVVMAAVAAVVLAPAGCAGDEDTGGMKVAATIAPLADMCRGVGGDLVEVELIVPAGASPHTFEPTSGQVKFLSEAKLFVYNGLELEAWITDIVRKVGRRELVEVAAAEGVPRGELIELGGHEGCGHDHGHDGQDGHDHGHGIYDPHVWLDPGLASYQVEAIRDGLIEADPGNEEAYRMNAGDYIERLRELDEYLGEVTATFTKRRFVSHHSAFGYFARRYNLEQVGTVVELPGREPGAGEIARLVEDIREWGVQVIFTEPQFSPQVAEAVAAESGIGVVLQTLDPLGDPNDPATATYFDLMRTLVDVMSGAMR